MNQPEEKSTEAAGPVVVRISDLPDSVKGIAEVMGLNVVLKMSQEFGGDAIYFPKYQTLMRGVRNRMVRAEFDGSNHKELAKKFNLTPAFVRMILKGRKTSID